MPAVGFSSVIDDHTSMGTGALISEAACPRVQTGIAELDPGARRPESGLRTRLRPTVSKSAGLADMQRVAAASTRMLRRRSGRCGVGEQCHRPRRAAPSRDRQLRDHRTDARRHGRRTGDRRHGGPGPHARPLLSVGDDVTWLFSNRSASPGTAGHGGRMAGVRDSGIGIVIGVPLGITAAGALDPLRPGDLCRPPAERPGGVSGARGSRRARLVHRRRHRARARRGTDSDGPAAAGRLTRLALHQGLTSQSVRLN